ncbi:MAG: peptidoglycan DD-metalloendopeptidase family protein [Minwuia sp.]|uniref:peptidoglycan DD-metalloendopeptidase family protein n=1 Tax=Minwuia sp. TaxID=2493630 RepID=UPI003A897D0F
MFRERQLFIRADGRVRYLRLPRAAQISAAVLVVATAGWATYATLSMQQRGDAIASLETQVAELGRERTRLNGELAATRAFYSNAAAEISRQYRELEELASVRGALESRLIAARTRLAAVEAEYRNADDEGAELKQQVAWLRDQLSQRDIANATLSQRLTETGSALAGATEGRERAEAERRERERQLAFLETSLENTASLNQHVREKLHEQHDEMERLTESRDIANTEIRRLSSKIAALNSDLNEAYRSNSSLRRRLAATSDALTETHEHQVVAEQRGQHLARTIDTLEQRLSRVRSTQLELLRSIREKAQNNIAALEATLHQTGIPIDELLNTTIRRTSGLGGPLVALDDNIQNENTDTFEGMVGSLELDLLHWESMQTLMAHLPLTRPTTVGYISSHFGRRRDPINGRKAMHKGVDIAAPSNTPVFATASGVVTFAGSMAAYGRMVEIDHGFGFVTRYGHLRKILVKKGQRVNFHEEVGKMGTSGRSTGSHVHYEVLFEGKNVDPANFFEAGRYVFKVQDARG